MLKSVFVLLACCGLAFAATSDDLTGVKCLVNGNKNASKSASAKHKDGEVYFCCQGCVKKFEADPSAFEVKANHQLVVSGQYVQTGCPFSGNAVADGKATEVGGVSVGFCCDGCLKKVASAPDVAAKASLVFATKTFDKGFAKKEETTEIKLDKVKCFLMPKRGVNKEHAVDYKDGKVFFCCKGCPKKFAANKEKYAVQANQQLYATGQYVQTGCPFSGSEVDDEQTSKVGDMTVKFCCEHCKAKVDNAADDKARHELLFADKAFKKGFAKRK